MDSRGNVSLAQIYLNWFKSIASKGTRISIHLLKLMIPALLLVRILDELEVLEQLAQLLQPIMSWFHLPGSAAFVIATALFGNLYAALAVWASFPTLMQLTVAQASVLALIILIAHNLIVEMQIARQVGVRLRFGLSFRLVSAFFMGWFIYQIYSLLDLFHEPADAWFASIIQEHLSWWDWGVQTILNLGAMVGIIYLLVLLMALCELLRLTTLLEWCLKPCLRLLGMSEKSAPLATIGLLLGLAIGGGFLIEEKRTGKMTDRDVFLSIAFIMICHAMIEDTLLLLMTGAHWSAIILFRGVFSFGLILILARLVAKLDDAVFYRFLFHYPR